MLTVTGHLYVVVAENLEGQKYDGQRALVTGTFGSLHVCSKVINGLLVLIKEQGFKHVFLATVISVVYTFTGGVCAQVDKNRYSVSNGLVEARNVCLKSMFLAFTKQ